MSHFREEPFFQTMRVLLVFLLVIDGMILVPVETCTNVLLNVALIGQDPASFSRMGHIIKNLFFIMSSGLNRTVLMKWVCNVPLRTCLFPRQIFM